METRAKRFLLVMVVLVVASLQGWSQKGIDDGSRYGKGEDSIRCLRNLSIYREYAKHDNFTDAIKHWRIVFAECPQSSKNIYLDGVRIYKWMIEKENNPALQTAYIDTLMLIYDLRIKYYEEEGNVLGRKAIDLLRYRRDDLESIDQAFQQLKKSVDIEKYKSSEAVLATYMTSAIAMFKAGRIKDTEVVEIYSSIMDIIETNLKQKPNNRNMIMVRDNIEQNFAVSGAPNCSSLVSLFGPRYEANPTDLELLKKITTLMTDLNCTDTPLFEKASESRYALEPSAAAASSLANMFAKKNDTNKAIEYYKKAIELEVNPTEKANQYYQLASIAASSQNQPEQARRHALEAIKLNPSWGAPYILIGQLYVNAARTCGANDFERNAVYWVAVDKFRQAKTVDTSVTEEANRLIDIYSQYYPNKENAFFYGITDGSSYTVGCWINEATTARF